jgi:anti-sigma factor RsiW
MSTYIPEHPTDWEAQRERLSALLDGQLGAAESTSLRAHERGCAACAAELEALRSVVGALKALPQPVAPRSFALPITTALPDAAPVPRSIAAARARRAPWATLTQWAGAAAASIGLFILLGSLALGGGYGQSSATSFGPMQHAASSGRSANATAQPPAVTTASPAQNDISATRSAVGAAPAITPTPITTTEPTKSPLERTAWPAAPPDPRAAARTAGAALLLGGLAALLLGWGVRRRHLAPR